MFGVRSRRSMLDTLVRHRNLVRFSALRSGAIMTAALALAACVGTIDGGSDGTTSQTPEQLAATAAWTEKAVPQLKQNCVSCHDGRQSTYPLFLVGNDDTAMRATLLAYTPGVVSLDAPPSSRLLTKGAHLGQAWTGPQASDILEWLQKEKIAAGSTGTEPVVVETDAITPMACISGEPGNAMGSCPINTVPLDTVGITGGSISFVMQPIDSALYLQRLVVHPGTAGAYIEHPLVVSYPMTGDPKADTLDRFFNVKLNVKPTDMPAQIAGGAAVFVGFSPGDPIRFHFKVASAYQEATPTDPGGTAAKGCKDLASFRANAVPQLNPNCGSCHKGQNGNATNSVAMTGMDSADDAVAKMACNQILLRANLQDLPNSSLYAAPKPGNTTHPFRFPTAAAATAFESPIDLWLTAERDAP